MTPEEENELVNVTRRTLRLLRGSFPNPLSLTIPLVASRAVGFSQTKERLREVIDALVYVYDRYEQITKQDET